MVQPDFVPASRKLYLVSAAKLDFAFCEKRDFVRRRKVILLVHVSSRVSLFAVGERFVVKRRKRRQGQS